MRGPNSNTFRALTLLIGFDPMALRRARITAVAIAALMQSTLAMAQAANVPVNCTVSPAQTIELSAPVMGVVADVSVVRGGRVDAGDIIVRLDDDLARSEASLAIQQAAFDGAIRAAEAQLANLLARRDRLQIAVDQRAIPQADFDALLLEIALAEIAVERQIQDRTILQLQAEQSALLIEKLTIRSPISAVIGEDLISVGESTANRPVVTLYAVDSVRIEAFVPVPLLDDILATDALAVTSPGSDRDFPVTLDYVAPAANLSSNTIAVYFFLHGDGLRPGSTCRLVY